MEHLRFNPRWFTPLWLLAACLPIPLAAADEASAQYSVASGFYNMSRYDFAAEEYEKFLSSFPKHEQVPEALYFLGESYYHLNKVEEARTRYRQMVDKYSTSKNYFNALYRLGETSLLVGDPKSAETTLKDFVGKRPDDPLLEFALPYLGRAQLQSDKRQDAKATLRKAIEKFPKGRLIEQTQFDLAQALDQPEEKDEAVRLFQTIAANPMGKLADHAAVSIGTRQFDDKNYEAALQAFQDLERRFPKSQFLETARLNRALCLYQLKRYDQAQSLLESLTKAESKESAEARYWLGMSLKARAQWDAAAQSLLDSYAKFPDSDLAPEMLFYGAHSLFQSGKFAPAQEQFLKFVEKYRKHDLADDSLYFVAEALRSTGEHDRMFVVAAQFFREFPKSPFVDPLMLAVGQSLIAVGRNADAAKYLGELSTRQIGPELSVPAQYYRGLALRGAGNLDEAIKVLEPLLSSKNAQEPAFQQIVSDAYFLTGTCYFEKKDYSRAVPLLQKYLAAQPSGDVAGHAASYLAVSFAELKQLNDLPGALAIVRSRAGKEVSLPALFRVAETCLEAKQYTLAAELYAEVAQKDEQGSLRVRALSGAGWARFSDGKFDAAAQAFRQVVEVAPTDALASEAAYMVGRSLEADGKFADAVEAYRQVIAKYAESTQAPDAALQLPRMLQKLNKGSDAVAAYEDAAKRFPKAKQLDVILYEWAWALQQSGAEADAQKIFERLATQFPKSSFTSEAVINVCETLFQAKEYAAVVSRLTPLLSKELPPATREAALYRLGRTQVELGAWAEAKTPFEQLTKEFPTSRLRREAEFWTAEAERQTGNPKAATDRLTRLIAEPVAPESWLGTAYLRLAQAQGEQKQWKELLATTEQLRKQFPRYELMSVADYHTGRALQNLARFDEARDAYRRGIAGRTDENAAQCQFMIGETYFHQRRFQEALREYLKVEILYAFPQWQAGALLEAAKCHESLQEWSRAVETYNRIIEKYPKTTHVQEASERRAAAVQKTTAGTSKK
jgi:TolA-binding protein